MVSISKVRPLSPTNFVVKVFLHGHSGLKNSFFVPTISIWLWHEASAGYILYIDDQESIMFSSFAN